jgi:hypothetical protein
MDPNLFHVDSERAMEAVGLIVLLAFIVERALAVIFESRKFVEATSDSAAKEIIASIVSIAICMYWQFDAISMIILSEKNRVAGYIVTGLVIAGGSKGAVKLFHDLLNVQSSAVREAKAKKQAKLCDTPK